MDLKGVVVGIILFGGSAALAGASATIAAAGAVTGLIVAAASAVKD